MKKAIAILLVLAMALGLCACAAEPKETEPAGIELTLDNYDDYLDIIVAAGPTKPVTTKQNYWLGFYSGGYRLVHSDFYAACRGYINLQVLAPNFNFHDVTIKVRFTGSVLAVVENSDPDNPRTQKCDFEFEDTFELSVGGTVKSNEPVVFDLPDGMLIVRSISEDKDRVYSIHSECEIIEISGTAVSA